MSNQAPSPHRRSHLRVATSVLIATIATIAASPTLAHDDDHAHAKPLEIGARHPSAVDVTRFHTNRDAPPLPLPSEQDSFFFAVFGDRTGGPPEGVEILADAVRDVNLIEPDLVMTVGDLIQGYNTTAEWMPQMREFKGIMDRLLCPWFPVAGNHDVYWRGPGRPPGEHERSYEVHFGPLWYAFEHKDAWFIVLYSDEGDPVTGRKTFNDPACQVMSDEQLSWFDGVLARAAGARHVFVFLHHPRWIGGGYGNDWDRVHARLAAAGNVRAVFAGHIHRMRYDGPRDGIEYVTLATTGGGQSGVAPEAGYLHHLHLVTVRPDQIAIAAVPVGEVMDVRAITGEVSDETRALAALRPAFSAGATLDAMGRTDDAVAATITNPVSRPMEITLIPDCDDPRWSFRPDHRHLRIEAGESATIEFVTSRADGGIDETLRIPVLRQRIDYLAPGRRYPIRETRASVPVSARLARPLATGRAMALSVDGDGDYLEISSDQIVVPDGPLTVECLVRVESQIESAGLVTKTESSEFGLWIENGAPTFYLFLDDRYVEVQAPESPLRLGQWHHVAGVFDGEESRLYVDGALAATIVRSGRRRVNALPLLVGADVDGRGRAASFFTGMIDDVRVSTTARYRGPRFAPRRDHRTDRDTVLLLDMQGRIGPWLYDGSGHDAHPIVRGDAAVVNAAD